MKKKWIIILLTSFSVGLLTDRFLLPRSLSPVPSAAATTSNTLPVLQPAAALVAAPQPGGGEPAGGQANDKLICSRFTFAAKVDLSQVTITWHITPTNRSADAGMQVFVHRDDVKTREQWDTVNPIDAQSHPLIFNLYQGQDNTGTFVLNLPKGVYGQCRVLLFDSPDGKRMDLGRQIYDNAGKTRVAFDCTVKTEDRRVTAPALAPVTAESVMNEDGTANVVLKTGVKIPENYTADGGGFWVMTKGAAGFKQVWAGMKNAQEISTSSDRYKQIAVEMPLQNVKPGIYLAQVGLFKPSFGDPLQWLYPGVDFEVGNGEWVKPAPAENLPLRLRVRKGRFETEAGQPYNFYPDNPNARRGAAFVRGGNYGNAITWTIFPELNRPGYFVLLKSLGCRYIRFNFNPDRYHEPIYQHAVDQVVQNILAAGLYPVIAPQDLPQAGTREGRVEKGYQVVRTMAAKYVGKPVWLEICNEPHDFGTWEEWRPVAIRYVQAIRKIDPDAFVIVPFENFGKDGRGAAKNPITETPVDLYDGHAYLKPEEIATVYAPATKAGLPVLIGEYGGGDAAYLTKINMALQSLSPPPLAAGPWAFTIKGQDSLPLVESGGTAALHLTSTGQAIADAYTQWDAGKKLK